MLIIWMFKKLRYMCEIVNDENMFLIRNEIKFFSIDVID